MNAAAWISIAGAVIAAATAWYARRQATQARRSAVAADRQAAAMEQQVAIMREQLANEAADRHQAARPRFTVQDAEIKDDPGGNPFARLTIQQDGGSAVSEVRVTLRPNQYVCYLIDHFDSSATDDARTDAVVWGDPAPGTTHELMARLEYDHFDPVHVVLDFTSVQAGTGNTWQDTLTAIPRRPETNPGRRRRRVWESS